VKIAVLSDIHANFDALRNVLADAQQREVERFWLLGDLVGYGPQPVECLEWFRKEYRRIDYVIGNHEAMLVGLEARVRVKTPRQKLHYQYAFRELAEAGMPNQPDDALKTDNTRHLLVANRQDGTTGKLSEALEALSIQETALRNKPEIDQFWRRKFKQNRIGPREISVGGTNYWIVHASRGEGRQLDSYIYPWSSYHLELEMKMLTFLYESRNGWSPVCQFHGHTHVPYLVTVDTTSDHKWSAVCVEPDHPYPLGRAITLANPGSVGQPRDGDTRACYAILDTGLKTITFRRIPYPYKKTIKKMIEQGIPDQLRARIDKASYPNKDEAPPPEWRKSLEIQVRKGK